MKYLIGLLALLSPVILKGQHINKNLQGVYQDYFGSSISLNADFTFKYNWHFDLASSWNKGTWHTQHDTLYLKTILVYDILRKVQPDGLLKDTLVVSDDEVPNLITDQSFATMLYSGGQNQMPCPKKLLYRSGKLLILSPQGKPIRKKVKGVLSGRKSRPWYIKQVTRYSLTLSIAFATSLSLSVTTSPASWVLSQISTLL